jgi:hypothetical protein
MEPTSSVIIKNTFLSSTSFPTLVYIFFFILFIVNISENMHPQFNYNGGHYNWGMQQPYWNYNSHLMNSSYQTPSTVPEFPSQKNIGAITSYRPKESHHLQLRN